MMPDRRTPPPNRPFGKMSVPAQTVLTLPNGMTLHVYDGGDQPVCNLSVIFPGGSSETGSECMSMMLASQTIEGTARHDAGRIVNILDYNGTRSGFRSFAHQTVADFRVLNTRAADVIPLIAEIISQPTYPEDRLSTTRLRVTSSMLAAREDVSALAWERFNELIWGPGNPIGKPLTQDIIDSISSEALLGEHRLRFAPKGMHVLLSGMVDDGLRQLVADHFGKLVGNEEVPPTILSPMAPALPGLHHIDKPDSFQAAVVCGMPTIGRTDPDYIPLRLAILALGGYFGSRLMTNIREEKGLTYGIYSSLSGGQDGAFMSIAAQCETTKAGNVVDEIRNEIRLLADNPPCGEELRRMKLNATTSLAETLDSPHSVLGYYLNMMLVGTPENYFETQLDVIDRLTADDISAVVRKHLDPERLVVVTAG